MGLKDLETFLENKDDTKQIWEKDKKNWLKNLKDLFETINNWLKPLSNKQLINLKKEIITITEPYIGEYETEQIIITLRNSIILIKPIGTLIVGAYGRVDIIGHKKDIKILYVPEDSKNMKSVYTQLINSKNLTETEAESLKNKLNLTWKIATNPPNVQYLPFDENSFSDLILDLIS